MRGPSPKPTNLKILSGVRPFRINRDEPQPPTDMPSVPDYLDSKGIDLWEELASTLSSMGVLTIVDRHAFGMLCDSYSRWRRNPGDAKMGELFRKLMMEFGMTPSSRSRIKVNIEAVDDLDEFRSAGKRKSK